MVDPEAAMYSEKIALAGLYVEDKETGEVRHAKSLKEWLERFKNRTRIRTELPSGKYVSTVFLGVDQRPHDDVPVVWETMVFDRSRKGLRGRGYRTRQEALEGHEQMVQEWSSGEAASAE